MPTIKEYKYPFSIVDFNIQAGQDVPSDYIRMGNFTPVGILFPSTWTTSPVTFNSYYEVGNDLLDGGLLYDNAGNSFAIVVTNSPSGTWIPLDPRIFGGTTIFTFTTGEAQVVEVNGVVIGSPLYTIGTGV